MSVKLLEAVGYLHEEAYMLHNDIKANNILVARSLSSSKELYEYNIVLNDFGKATKLSEGKQYKLNTMEKSEYLHRFPHIAPEIVEGEYKQSIYSDSYSIGKIMLQIINHGCIEHLKLCKQRAFATV